MKPALLVVAIGLALGQTPAALATSLSPVALYRQATQLNPRYQAAVSHTEAERAGLDAATSRLLPRLSLSASLARNSVDNSVAGSGQRYRYENSHSALQLNLPLYNRYHWAQRQQSALQVQLADTQLDTTGSDLLLQICRAYFDVLLSRDRLRFIRAQQDSILSQKAAAAKRLQLGFGTRIEVDDAEARARSIVADEIEVQGLLQNQLAALANLTGQNSSDLRPLGQVNAAPLLQQPLSHWEAQALVNNSTLIGWRQQLAIAEQEIEKAGAGHYPSIDLFASSSRSQNDSVHNLSSQRDNIYRLRNVGVQLDLPLLGGGVSATVRQAIARKEQATHWYEAAQAEIRLQVASSYRDIETATARLLALEQAENAAMQTVVANQRGIEAGAKSTLDVLQAEELRYRTKLQYAATRYQLAMAIIQLRLLSRNLGDETLDAVDALFRAG